MTELTSVFQHPDFDLNADVPEIAVPHFDYDAEPSVAFAVPDLSTPVVQDTPSGDSSATPSKEN